MCATFEVQMTNGLIDEMKWGKLNTLSLSQFRVWPFRSNRQLRFDKKDVYGNYVLQRNTPERNVDL